MNISRGVKPGPVRVLIYGPEGIGKTRLASQFPNPLFIDTESGTNQIDVNRFDRPQTWGDLINMVTYVIEKGPGLCGTLVIDTLDWAEKLAIDDVINSGPKKGGVNQWTSIESPSYGKGYVYLADRFTALTQLLDKVIAMGINVCMTAHAKMRKFEQPDESGSYDRWELKLTRNVAPVCKEWADMVLFLNYKVLVTKNAENKAKAHGGERTIYANHTPSWDAKNRFNLPDQFPLDYSYLAGIIPGSLSELVQDLKTVMASSGITEEEMQWLVGQHDPALAGCPIDQYSDVLINGWIRPNWDKCIEFIKQRRTAQNGVN